MLPALAQSLKFPDVSQLEKQRAKVCNHLHMTFLCLVTPCLSARHLYVCTFVSLRALVKLPYLVNSLRGEASFWSTGCYIFCGKRLNATHSIPPRFAAQNKALSPQGQSVSLEYSFYLSITFQNREKISMILKHRQCRSIYTHNSETFSALCVSPLISGHWWQSSVSRYLPFEAGVPSPVLMA